MTISPFNFGCSIRQVAPSNSPADHPQAEDDHGQHDRKAQQQDNHTKAQTPGKDPGSRCGNPKPDQPQAQPLLLSHETSIGPTQPAPSALGFAVFRMTSHGIHLYDNGLFSTPVRGRRNDNGYHNFPRICVPPVSKNGLKWWAQGTQRKGSSMAKALSRKGKRHSRHARFGGRDVPVVALPKRST